MNFLVGGGARGAGLADAVIVRALPGCVLFAQALPPFGALRFADWSGLRWGRNAP